MRIFTVEGIKALAARIGRRNCRLHHRKQWEATDSVNRICKKCGRHWHKTRVFARKGMLERLSS